MVLKTWDDITSIDEVVPEPELLIIRDLEREDHPTCSHLRKIGQVFFYCGGALPEHPNYQLEPFDPVIGARQSVVQLQLHCWGSYETCCHYRGTLPFPGVQLR